jgi:23S rRNA pseudouridine2605 synthase
MATKNTIRLNKFIANSGLCSRREADMHIGLGTVKVNGKIVTEMGYQVQPGDEVKFDGQRINADKPTYVLLNKPKGFLAAVKKGTYKKDVLELIARAAPYRIDPIHAMDRSTTGLLLFTNDQQLTTKLRSLNTKVKKIYQVVLDKNLSGEAVEKIKKGIAIDRNKVLSVEDISFIHGEPKRVVGIEIHDQTYNAVNQIF